MIIAGLAFKASAAPFHMWTPDVYQGAPTPVTRSCRRRRRSPRSSSPTALLVTAFPERGRPVDVGGRGDRVRLAGGRQHRRARAAERQADARVLVGLARRLHADRGRRAQRRSARSAPVLPHPLRARCRSARSRVVAARERELGVPVTLENLSGFGWERPFLGVAMWVFMLGFAGFPLTGGFCRQVLRLRGRVRAGWRWLMVVGVVATMVSAVLLPRRRARDVHARQHGAAARPGGRLTPRRRRSGAARRPSPRPAVEWAIGATASLPSTSRLVLLRVEPLIDVGRAARAKLR